MSESFSERLRRLRTVAGLTQEQVADGAGVPLTTLRNWERGRREPLASAVSALARALGVTADELLGMSEEEPVMGKATITEPVPPADASSKPGRGRPRKEQVEEPPVQDAPEVKKKGKRKEG